MDDGRGARGFTLIELLAVIALVAILAGAAVPAFARLLLDSRRDAGTRAMLQAIHVARQLAAVRGHAARICGSRDGQHCDGGDEWAGSLLVTGDRGPPYRVIPVPAQGIRLLANRTVVFFEAGSGFATPATVAVCDRRGAKAARAVIISRSGRPRVDTRDPAGGPIRC